MRILPSDSTSSTEQPAPADGEPSILHKVSIVVPVYCGEHTLGKLIDEILPLTRPRHTPGGNLFQIQEVVLVHDCGPDRSDLMMEALAARHPFIRVVWLSRNFGQHPATLAGLSCTVGDWVVTIDEDGQQDPRDIAQLLDLAVSSGTQLVYARPTNPPPHGMLRNAFSTMAKWIFVHGLGNAEFGRFNSFRLIQGEIARSLAAYSGPNIYLDVALSWMVARTGHCDVKVRHGSDRPSGYSYVKLLKHFLRLVLTSGTRPLRLISLIGLMSIAVSLGICGFAVWEKVNAQIKVEGWTSLIIVLCFFSGCILTSLGIIAEYLGATLTMTMGKPLYVIVPRPSRSKAA